MLRVGSVSYACEQGLGRLMKSFYAAGIVDDVMVYRHTSPSRPTLMSWYPPSTLELVNRPFNGPTVDAFLKTVDVMLFWETPFDWGFMDYCRARGVRTALVPMSEWTPRRPPAWFDIVISPSLEDHDYFKDGRFAGFTFRECFLPIPVDPSTWRQRTVAKRFLHNAGHLGHGEHKGTRQLLEAMKHVKSDLTLTVRGQHDSGLQNVLRQVFGGNGTHPKVEVVAREIPYEELFTEHDVYVAPEKWNPISLPLQEARAAGMLVLTTDRYPMNTWLPKEGLIPAETIRRGCVSRNYLEVCEAVVRPEAIAAKMDACYGTDITAYSQSGKAWAEEHSWANMAPKWRASLEL